MATNRQRLMSAARRLLASRAEAEDAVQDTYVRALASFPDSLESQPAWLHTVLRNVAIDRLRRRQLEADHADCELPPDVSLDSVQIRSECEAALRHLLKRVTPTEAVAILLCDVFEFDHNEVARIVGKSNDASRQFLHRARMRAHRAGASLDVDETYVALCWRAIETRDPALLMDMLPMITASAQHQSTTGQQIGARTSSKLVQVNGRYALALVLDGVVLCIVPVGPQAMLVGGLI